MAYKLIYIDDENTREVHADSLTKGGVLEIQIVIPSLLEKTRDELLNNKVNLDGIILDLKLDGNKEGKEHATYTAPSLAQAIRSSFSNPEGGFDVEIPIFLLTSQENIEKYYEYDLTSHDLFDYIFFKQNLSKDNNYINTIVGIIESYRTLNSTENNLNDILKIDLEELNQNIFPSKFHEKGLTSNYILSNYILRNVVKKAGILICEKILGARLGVDIEKSPNWNKLIEILNDSVLYKGIYSSVFPRWWSHRLINWWRDEFPSSPPLIRLNAQERVTLILDKFKIDGLTPATPIAKATESKFWTICQAIGKPLDIKDGILLDDSELKVWQDKQYISLESILERYYVNKGLRIHPQESERITELKKGF